MKLTVSSFGLNKAIRLDSVNKIISPRDLIGPALWTGRPCDESDWTGGGGGDPLHDMKLLSWNVNGIRSALGKGFLDFVAAEAPDILCLQETRGYPPNIAELLPDYQTHWNHAEKKGYSGVAFFFKQGVAPRSVGLGIGKAEHDREGRVIYAEFDDYFLLNVYTPNAGDDLKRLEYRMAWDAEFLKFLKKLEKKKPVLFCGDLNVAHEEIDLARPKENKKSAGFTDEERAGFSKLVKAGFVDTFRMFNQEPGHYSWWSFRANSRARNVGWRIDYFLASEALRPRVKRAFILPQILGSDHCPVGVEFL